jgi:hypothetical protein
LGPYPPPPPMSIMAPLSHSLSIFPPVYSRYMLPYTLASKGIWVDTKKLLFFPFIYKINMNRVWVRIRSKTQF